eukprot:13020822-Alexandrium_andersonii.AAC.1
MNGPGARVLRKLRLLLRGLSALMADRQQVPRRRGVRLANAIRVPRKHVDVDIRPAPTDRPDDHWEDEE